MRGISKRYLHTRVGVGGRMDTLRCVAVFAKFKRSEWEIAQRLRIGALHHELLVLDELDLYTMRSDRTRVCAGYTNLVNDRDAI